MKKTLAALLVLLFALAPVSVLAADAFTLTLSSKEVRRGGELTLSGTVSGEAGGGNVTIKIVSPAQTVLYVDVIPAVSGSYSAAVGIPASEDLAPLGRYTVIAGSGSETKTDTFSVVTGGGTPGGGSIVSPAPTPQAPSADASGIPAGAGQASGSTARPDLAADGRYLVGSGTLAAAAQQAGSDGTVTIELPSASGEAGTALELPGRALSKLTGEGQGLIITTGSRTVEFPAGAFALSGEASSRVRIVLNAAWSAEAKTTVEQSVRADSDYKPTGVVLSVVVQIIVGDQVKEIHQLDRPATVSIQLTPEQEKLISGDLAGVYYVNGQGAEYVSGNLVDGIFTFTAEHFSYYAILEYNKTFLDLSGHWAEAAVKTLAAKHIVTGVDARHYAPNRSITRAEFVTLVMRSVMEVQAADGGVSPAKVGSASPFKDVASDRYYAEAVAQAAQLGIVSGYNGAFRPNELITREEAVVSLVRAAEIMNTAAVAGGQKPPAFADAQDISAWAVKAVDQAWSQGWIQGDGSNFNPRHDLTRAEVAAMLRRLL
ncbi:S-layer homology domain-containing protein [Paenibacillus timonensis]|uniref:S-layer homology domain-containing protein n=1 Tax=Paenibacillus timonensis TaxID=225915 RepID=UPI003F9D6B02